MFLADLFTLCESPQQDAPMADIANRASLMVVNAIHGGLAPMAYIGLVDKDDVELGDFLVYDAEMLGLTREFPVFARTAIMVGSKQERAIGLSGFVRDCRDKPFLDRFDTLIAVRGMSEVNPRRARSFVVSTNVLRVLQHEIIHRLDDLRTNDRISLNYPPTEKRQAYFNHPAETNAFFHNIASNWFQILSAGAEGAARDYAELTGFTGDFTKDVAELLRGRPDLVERNFLKNLRRGRHKALLRRLYKLHQAIRQAMAAEGPRDASVSAQAAAEAIPDMAVA